MKANRLVLCGLILLATVARAQDPEAPAAEPSALEANPALWEDAEPGLNPQPLPAVKAEPEASGSLILGEEDSPIGLYIMPWRNSAAEEGLGRPARLLQEALLPMDREVFKRQVDYYQTLAAHRARQAAAAPAPPAAP